MPEPVQRMTGADRQPDRENTFQGLSPSGFHDIAYADWGPIDDRRPVVCVHGLTRQGRDFDYLAAQLVAAGRRVICPDLPGRGRSGRLVNPDDYALPQYCADMNALLARLNVREVDWVGTSLGGLIGISLAGFRGSIIQKLVVNDIGPFVSATGHYFRTVLAPYGDLVDEHWGHLTQHSIRWDAERRHYAVLCDPAIAYAFRSLWFYPLNLWKYWEAIKVPILVLHGAKSDLLSADLTLEMRKRNPLTTIFRFDECGHVPPLMEPSQVKVVADFVAVK